ncbi:MAG: DNA-binding response regulator [Chloroflexi bacterium]|nr:MAG: DNA-binding response regulator [Chloroflexota bacterium]
MHVLLIERHDLDDETSLLPGLKQSGHHASVAHTPDAVQQHIREQWPDLIVLNAASGLPDCDRFQWAIADTRLDIPCVVIGGDSNHSAPAGKPCTTVVPTTDIEQLNNAFQQAVSEQSGRFFRMPTLTIDFLQQQVLRNGEIRGLTPKEFKLLNLLVTHKNQVMSRKEIMLQVWDTDYMGDTRTLDVHIRWLREKIEEEPSQPDLIRTIRGVGYRFVDKTQLD